MNQGAVSDETDLKILMSTPELFQNLNFRLVKNCRPHFACEIPAEGFRKTSTSKQYSIHAFAMRKLLQTCLAANILTPDARSSISRLQVHDVINRSSRSETVSTLEILPPRLRSSPLPLTTMFKRGALFAGAWSGFLGDAPRRPVPVRRAINLPC